MLGVDRVKHISLMETAPVLMEERRVNETYIDTTLWSMAIRQHDLLTNFTSQN